MTMYKRLSQGKGISEEEKKELRLERLKEWRKEPSVKKIDNPTKLSKARSLGYKAKNGINLARVKVRKGGSKRERITAGRRPKRTGQVRFSPTKSKEEIAEERASRKHPNLEVLNSYHVEEDGNFRWFEVIMIDPERPEIAEDEDYSDVAKQTGRAERGLT